jgi:sigma-E factor negative regulatory protein RseA
MDKSKTTQEQISAFADGELLTSNQIDAVLTALRSTEGRAAWEAYHHIGDALRSDDTAMALSSDFSARLAARLEDEPSIVAPDAVLAAQSEARSTGVVKPFRRLAFSGAVAATVAAIAVVGGPQLMVASNGVEPAAEMVASGPTTTVNVPVAVAVQDATPEAKPEAVAADGQVILRDPRIDEYLMAHQRFSPSPYSTAQYARSATFTTDSDK